MTRKRLAVSVPTHLHPGCAGDSPQAIGMGKSRRFALATWFCHGLLAFT
jgi:hypothetical protein